MKTLLFLAMTALSLASATAGALDSIPLKDIDGKDTSLKAYAGKAVLIVNVASECGYTPQYTGLEALYKKYKDQGLVILGFPCNDFGGQEPGSAEEIKTFCSSTYSVTFPMFAKVAIKGASPHPLYAALVSKEGSVGWNFTKFLIGRDGAIISKFDSAVEPDSAELTGAIEKALAAK
ncbi:MAG: hypothetical protein JWO94_496 [Verrucomicrobiaceae bacterium]|nr:hypothetical protein [Verrucomicrobiaceae bacterium]